MPKIDSITPQPGTRVAAKVGDTHFYGTVVAVILPAAFEVSPAIVWDGVLSKGSTKGPRIHFDPINPDGTFGKDTPFRVLEEGDRPWTGGGPSVAEAGGQTILFRDGKDLRLARWDGHDRWVDERGERVRAGRYCGRYQATGWRPMPKA